jgi:aminoglycoside phosphotransferase family enzyme/adenylate kinase family enzyme
MDTMANKGLISALRRKEAYDHPVDDISLRETHISWVFLTGHYAYKIKKPVDFGFLDFTSLEKRKHYCEEEVRLNGRLAPHLYLGVVSICGDTSTPRINGQGPVIEYAVKMRQFDTSQEFDELLARDELTKEHMDKTAKVLAEFHASITLADEQSPFGTPEAIQQPVLENFEQLEQLGEDWLSQHQLKKPMTQLHQWSNKQYRKLETTLQERKKNGFVRECHGDLHLRNIVIYKGHVTPFDGIEFNSNLRWIDVMSELAFLLMDIEDHNRFDLSRRLRNSYLEITGDYTGLSVLHFYQTYRAMVRAKVAGLQFLQSTNSSESKNESPIQEINNYIKLACRYTQSTAPKLIISHGLSGSGKTTLSQLLLEQTDTIRLRSDVERKQIFGMKDTARDKSGINKGIYTEEASQQTYECLLQIAGGVLNSGYSVIIDAAFLKEDQRQKFFKYARKFNIPFLILHSKVNMDIQRQRLRIRQQQNRDASDANNGILNQQITHHEPLTNAELSHTITVDTTHDINLKETIIWLEKQ